MAQTQPDIKKRGLDYFRHVVALVYREIGVLRVSNHPSVFARAHISGGFFGANRKTQARELYQASLSDHSIAQTLERYRQRTGLTLDDVHEAFAAGKWSSASGLCNFGGPKWATIAEVGIKLGRAIEGEVWPEVTRLADLIETPNHNNGPIKGKFAQLD